MVIDLTQAWTPERSYPFRAIAVYDGAVWCSTRNTKGEVPGSGDAWYRLKDPSAIDKYTVVQTTDERIGRGL